MTELTNNDRASQAALKLKKIYLERLDLLRRQNDSTNLDEIQTASQRGRIMETKRLLKALGHEFVQTPKVTDAD